MKLLMPMLVLLAVVLPIGAQTKHKPVRKPGLTVSKTQTFGWARASSGFIEIRSGEPVDQATATCTKENLIQALRYTAYKVRDPNEAIGGSLTITSSGTWVTDDVTGWVAGGTAAEWRRTEASRLLARAKQLQAEADELEAESYRIRWARTVLANCETIPVSK